MDNELYEITEAEANEIVAWIRRIIAERSGSSG
jgi:hypothetical protein